MTLGFCLLDQQDVEIGADRRCLTDGSLVLPPSTGCVHMRLINGVWSACIPEGQNKPCKPVAAGTWRNALAQQDRVAAKRNKDQKRAAAALGQHGRLKTNRVLSAFPEGDGPPKLATAHKPQGAAVHRSPRVDSRPVQTCANASCGKPFKRHWGNRTQRFCSNACKALPPRACVGCGQQFKPDRASRLYCKSGCQNLGRRKTVAA